MFELAILTILLAFAFTFTNGFQDASSIAATFIASRSATPKTGIILVAVMSFFGTLLGGSAVAFTLAGLVSVPTGPQELVVIFAALVTATAWNLITGKAGLPAKTLGYGRALMGKDMNNWAPRNPPVSYRSSKECTQSDSSSRARQQSAGPAAER